MGMIKGMLTGSRGFLSFSRTQAAIGFLVCSGVVIWQAYQGTLSEAVFGLYFGFATAGYLGSKKIASDESVEKAKDVDA